MKKAERIFLIGAVSLLTAFPSYGQNQLRCGTSEHLEALLKKNPQLRLTKERNEREAERSKREYLSLPQAERLRLDSALDTLTSVIYIPVIVHIVLPNAFQISDQDVQKQIDILNIDCAGLNSDSVNIPASFKPLFGKSKIQFILARKNPLGKLTTGIERRNSNTASSLYFDDDPIKRSSLGGLDAWDYTKYLNIWIGTAFEYYLAYATFPGTDLPENQGIYVGLQAWGTNACYVYPSNAKGRILAHEIGHYFGLFHIWGDDGGACDGDDFRQLFGDCLLPPSLLFGDTPNQSAPTNGCPASIRTDPCTPNSPGIMYQNYMDYTDDACMLMFTRSQVTRMEFVLLHCRASYLTSDGAIPPVPNILNDASPFAVVNPGGTEFIGCTMVEYPGSICTGSIVPKVRIMNNGTDTLVTVNVGMLVDNGLPTVIVSTAHIPFGNSTVISFPATNFTAGTHTIKFFTSDPNTLVDQVQGNDTLVYILNVSNPISAPLVEGFESSVFPPSGWTISNPDSGSVTWTQTTDAKKSGNASAYINLYNAQIFNQRDYLISPTVDISNADSVFLSFERAYRFRFGIGVTDTDSLILLASAGCNSTIYPVTIWKVWGDPLVTTHPSGTDYGEWLPGATDWRRERFDIKPLLPPNLNTISVAFITVSKGLHNLWIDDVNISTATLFNTDMTIKAMVNPHGKICAATVTPIVEILNRGRSKLTSARIIYRVTGPASFNVTDSVNWSGAISTGGSQNVSLKQLSLPAGGTYNIIAYSKFPNNTNDEYSADDTIKSTIQCALVVPTPIREGFESVDFPPRNWAVIDEDNSGTWSKTSITSHSGASSVVMDNFNYDAQGTNDDLEIPPVTYREIDSAQLTFYLAYYNRPTVGDKLDYLSVFVTKDCGQTFERVYIKSGSELITVPNQTIPRTDPFIPTSTSDWRKETIDLTSALGATGTAQIIIRSNGNSGNSLFIDDINITTRTLPLKLKKNGYLISPNPFSSSITIEHYQDLSKLLAVQVINAAGQTIFSRNYKQNAPAVININLASIAVGVYAIRLIYTDKIITERVFKGG